MTAPATHRPPRPALSAADFWGLLEIARLPAKQLEAMAELKAALDALDASTKAAAAREAELTESARKQAAFAAFVGEEQAKLIKAAAEHQALVATHAATAQQFEVEQVKRTGALSERERKVDATEAAFAGRERALQETEAESKRRRDALDLAMKAREQALATKEAEFARRYAAAKAILDAVPATPAATNGAVPHEAA